MRIAVHATGDVARRASLILLNGTGLESLGLLDAEPNVEADSRVHRVEDIGIYDGLLTDDQEPTPAIERAVAAGIPVASWVEYTEDTATEVTVLSGCNLATGITPALAHHEAARSPEVMEEVLAWTEPGSPLRRGEAVAFPDPVGARWGRQLEARSDDTVPTARIAVPMSGDWAAASAQVTSAVDDGVVRRVVGVADLAAHLEAIALAAGVATLDAFPPGLCEPTAAAEIYLSKALEMGLAVASYVDGTSAGR